MVRERIFSYCSERGFQNISLNTKDMDLFCKSDNESAWLILGVDGAAIRNVNKQAFERYHKKITETYKSRGFRYISILTLFLSDDIQYCREIGQGSAYWIVDEKYGRVVVYDDQPEDFLGMRKSLEGMVSFLNREKQEQEDYQRRQAEERIRREQYEAALAEREKRRRREAFKKQPFVTITIILINILVFLLVNLFGNSLGTADWADKGELSWMKAFFEGEYYRLITCMFLHGGIDHILGNMIVLYAAGELLEREIGRVNFILVYFGGGILAGVGSAYYYYMQGEFVSSIGASGAVFAVIGALTIFAVKNKEKARRIGAPRIVFFALYALLSGFRGEGTDNAAHVAGLLAGGLILLIIGLVEDIVQIRNRGGRGR